MDEVVGRGGFPHGWPPRRGRPPRLRDLRRVVPIVQTVAVGGVVIILLSLDDYAEGFAVRLRLLLADEHPVAKEQHRREAAFQRRQAEAVRRGTVADFEAAGAAAFLAGTEEEESLPEPEVLLAASDDRGRRYRCWGGQRAWGSDLELREEPRYAPALDPAARELRLVAAQVQWRTAAVWQGGEVVAVDRGPWVFTVTL
jgi:hypothetical protein